MKRVKAGCIVLLLLLSACQDSDLATVAKALRDTSAAVNVFEQTVIDAHAAGFMSEEVARALLTVSVDVKAAGRDAVAITRELNALKPEDRSNLLFILDPVISTLANADGILLTAITDEAARNNARAAMTLMRTALNAAQLALAVSR